MQNLQSGVSWGSLFLSGVCLDAFKWRFYVQKELFSFSLLENTVKM